jgi:hypothetical protein
MGFFSYQAVLSFYSTNALCFVLFLWTYSKVKPVQVSLVKPVAYLEGKVVTTMLTWYMEFIFLTETDMLTAISYWFLKTELIRA